MFLNAFKYDTALDVRLQFHLAEAPTVKSYCLTHTGLAIGHLTLELNRVLSDWVQ